MNSFINDADTKTFDINQYRKRFHEEVKKYFKSNDKEQIRKNVYFLLMDLCNDEMWISETHGGVNCDYIFNENKKKYGKLYYDCETKLFHNTHSLFRKYILNNAGRQQHNNRKYTNVLDINRPVIDSETNEPAIDENGNIVYIDLRNYTIDMKYGFLECMIGFDMILKELFKQKKVIYVNNYGFENNKELMEEVGLNKYNSFEEMTIDYRNQTSTFTHKTRQSTYYHRNIYINWKYIRDEFSPKYNSNCFISDKIGLHKVLDNEYVLYLGKLSNFSFTPKTRDDDI